MANEAEVRKWNDVRQTSTWPAREQITGTVTPFLLDTVTVTDGARILDVGCGGGGLSCALAARVAPTGEVVGVDISDALLCLAGDRARQAGVDHVEFVSMDMQLGRLEGGPFDLAVSQFGVMFFDEPVVAFANIGAHLRPGGRLAFACWQAVDRNPWHVATALGRLVAAPSAPAPGKSATGPFTLGDRDHLTALLQAAGFGDIVVTSHDCAAVGSSSAIYDARLLEFMGVAPGHLGEAAAAVDAHLSRFRVGEDEFAFPLAFHVVTARRPSRMAGYSGTPLLKKLGIAGDMRLALIGEPGQVIGPLPDGVHVTRRVQGKADVAVAFFIERVDYERRIEGLGQMVFPAGALWVAWPKRTSGLVTTMTEHVVREVALPLGLVDNKVCAIDDTWSGLRVVWRRERRL